jgi:hypothetical protein
MREDEESRSLFNAANIRLQRAYAEVERLKGSSAASRVPPSDVIPVQVSPHSADEWVEWVSGNGWRERSRGRESPGRFWRYCFSAFTSF